MGGYDLTDVCVIALFVSITTIGALVFGGVLATESVRDKAIEAGVAEYRCDPQTGDCEFRFITEAEE